MRDLMLVQLQHFGDLSRLVETFEGGLAFLQSLLE